MTIVYELGGQALDAAKRIYMAQRALQMFEPAIQLPATLAEIGRLSRIFYDKMHGLTMSEMPELLARVGLDKPTITVRHDKDCAPRAYAEYPSLFTNGGKGDGIYLYAPTGYDGSHFAPADSKRLDDKEAERVGLILFGEGWNDPLSILPLAMKGTALPQDYAAPTSFTQDPYPARHFLPLGESCAAMKDFQTTKAAWDAHMTKICDALKAAILARAEATVNRASIDGDGLYVNVSYNISADTKSINISLRRDGKGGNIMKGGQPIPIPASSDYRAFESSRGEYEVSAHPHPETDEARAIKTLFDTIPPFADTKNYAALVTPEGRTPYLHSFGGIDFLYYSGMSDKDTFVPKDGRAVSNALYSWIRQDDEDAGRGVTPPPMPESIKRELVSLGLTAPDYTAAKKALTPA